MDQEGEHTPDPVPAADSPLGPPLPERVSSSQTLSKYLPGRLNPYWLSLLAIAILLSAVTVYHLKQRFSSNKPHDAFELGMAALGKKDYGLASQYLTEVVRGEPRRPEAWFYLGLARSHQGDYDRAITDYTEAIRLNPTLVEAYGNRGGAYHKKGQYDQAIADYDHFIRLRPNDVQVYLERAKSYGAKKENALAQADFQKAIALAPNDPKVYATKAILESVMKDYETAVDDFTTAIRLGGYPDLSVMYYGRSKAYRELGKVSEAESDSRRATELARGRK